MIFYPAEYSTYSCIKKKGPKALLSHPSFSSKPGVMMRRLFHPEPPKRPPLDRRPDGHHQLQRLSGHFLVNEPHTRIVPNKAAADSRTQLHPFPDVEDLHSAVIRPGGQDVFVNV